MSSTFSELTAAALVDALAALPEGNRHLVASIHGEPLADTFRAVLARSTGSRPFPAGQSTTDLRVFEDRNGCVIVPYLVQAEQQPQPRENRGSQGFASALRDHYSEAARPGERMMLLVFDASPNETLLTTMDQGVAQLALSLKRLLALALVPPDGVAQALVRVLRDLEGLVRADGLTAGLVARAVQAVEELSTAESNEDVSRELFRLPWCLSDPDLFDYTGPKFKQRLNRGLKERDRLSRWATDPSKDFDAEVRSTYGEAAAEKLLSARSGTAIEWQNFTLGDLVSGAPPEPPPDDKPAFTPPAVTVAGASSSKQLDEGRTVAAVVPGPGCRLTFHLANELRKDATIHVIGYGGAEPPFQQETLATVTAGSGGGTEPSIELPSVPKAREGWTFLSAVLSTGKRITKSSEEIRVALCWGGPERPLVYEIAGNIDLAAQAWAGDEQLIFVAELDGEQILDTTAQPPLDDFGRLVEIAPGFDAPAVQREPDEPPVDEEPAGSPEHLAIEAWADGRLAPGQFARSLRQRPAGQVVADVGPVSRPVADIWRLPASRWELERYVIEHPEATSFRLDATGRLRPNTDLEGLALGDLEAEFESFASARATFLAELAALPIPSVLGADLAGSGAASAYIAAYERLVEAVPDGEPGELGYDRILLSDSVTADSGEIFIAPTSPLSVAANFQLQALVEEWTSVSPGENYFAGDAGLISLQRLVPYLRFHTIGGGWFESTYAPYPWRCYTPPVQRTRQQRHPWVSRYVARRIEKFLLVHPSYQDERRTIRLAFVNPGSAAHVRDALAGLVDKYLRKESLERLPAFELQLLSTEQKAAPVVGADLDVFMSFEPEEGQPADADLELMKRLSYTKGDATTFLQDPKSFAHVLFIEDFFEARPELIEWERAAHPSSMYVSGLAADTERLANLEPAATRFLSAAWTGGAPTNRTIDLAARSTEIAASAAGVPVKTGVLRAADVRVPDSQIPAMYDRAVWVVHIDRQIGLELFAPQSEESGTPYILDYTDQETPEPGIVDGITATSQVAPYRARIRDVLEEAVSQPVPEAAAGRLLRTLNLISGRWGLEMLQTSTNVLRGRLATGLAAQVIEDAESLHEDPDSLTLVVALDELLRVSGGEGLALGQGWAAKASHTGGASDDLFVLTVPLAGSRPHLTGRIVEVKYRSAPGASAEDAANQLKQTHDLLTRLLVSEAQPGRMFQGRHLVKLILRYASRHVAYGLRAERPVLEAGAQTLSCIAAGDYELELGVPRGGKQVCGDYVSIEPELQDGSLAPQAAEAAGIDIGRIRIGAPVIAAMLQSGVLPGASSGMAAAPAASGLPAAGEEAPSRPGEVPPATEAAPPLGETAGDHDVPLADHIEGGRPEPPAEAAPAEQEPTAPASVSVPREEPPPPEVALPEDEHPQGPGDSGEPEQDRFALPPEELRTMSGRLDDVLTSYSLPLQPVQPSDAVCGPNTVRFRVRMARGGTIAQVEARERDIMRELGLQKEIMVGQEAGFVTLDVPRASPVTVRFRDIAPALDARPRVRGELPVAFGVDLSGSPQIKDLAQLPHLLVAGTTGSGKSVFLSSILASLAKLPPDELQILLVDVKGLDFAPYASLPHLRQPPIGDAEQALEVLEELYETERSKRRNVLAGAGAQSILDYYTRLEQRDLPQIVIVVDEFSNLLSGDKATGSRLEDIVQQYAEIMRSFGVYLVIATQRPSADIVTGRIKANLPARCALYLPTHADSMTILGRRGAEQLLGNGDMLFYREGSIERLQVPFTGPQDVLGAAGL